MATPERVVIVDDEPEIRAILRAYLEREGYAVGEAATAERAGELVAGADAILLDLGLPDRDGLDILPLMRARTEAFILVLTARAEEIDLLDALRLGADDYVTKPFSPREVVARVEVGLRRMRRLTQSLVAPTTPGSGTDLANSALVIDDVRHEVRVDGTPVSLTVTDFDLLQTLASQPGRVWSRQQLLELVWGTEQYIDERVVDAHIRSLRAALTDSAEQPRFIETVRGVGYRMVEEVQ